MFRSTRARAIAACATLGTCLAAAPAASADAVRYSVAPNPSLYTVKDNGNGLIKVSYIGCVTAEQAQNLQFTFSSDVSKDAHATFKLLQVKGTEPTPIFTPPDANLVAGDTQQHTASLAYTFDTPTQTETAFRVKLEPDNGSGLGQAAGVEVSVPCILAPAIAPPPPGAPAPGAPGAPGAPAPAAPTVPTSGYIPPTTAVLAARGSRCIATPMTLRLRAGETSVVRVTVRSVDGRRLNGALVRATYPGGRQDRRTTSDGTATFRIKARRAGTLVLQSEVCFGADRRRVLPQRVVRTPRRGNFTG